MHPRSGRWIKSIDIPPEPPPKRIIKPDISKEFLKGMLWAFLIVMLLHIGLAYVLYFY